MDRLCVGIDVANTSFVAAAQGPAGDSLWGGFANTPAGFAQWQARVCAAVDEWLTPDVMVVLEPTGGYELAQAEVFVAFLGTQHIELDLTSAAPNVMQPTRH